MEYNVLSKRNDGWVILLYLILFFLHFRAKRIHRGMGASGIPQPGQAASQNYANVKIAVWRGALPQLSYPVQNIHIHKHTCTVHGYT